MKHPIIFGLQYGDEGKGKITDVLARQAEWIIRFNGGNNAGHTLWLNGKKLVTHSVPSGVMYPHTKNFIGAGCVIDPVAFAKELRELSEGGASLNGDRLKVDFRAHVTLPIHLALDSLREAGAKGVGSTKRGIGPTYTTKTDRTGVRVGDLFEKGVEDRVTFLCKTFNTLLQAGGVAESSVEENLKAVSFARDLLRQHLSSEIAPFYQLAKKSRCVLEGAQAVHLDIDHGGYPFVTSSNTLPSYASVGTPFPSSRMGASIGIAKAYLTRVGKGEFKTELEDETGERIRKNGNEFGSTTGRPRRTGWLNLDELKSAVEISDCTYIALTKSDVLNNEKVIKYWVNGKYEELPGWPTCTVGDKLHPNLEAYVEKIEAVAGVPVIAIGTGADRESLYWRKQIKDFWG